MNTIVRRLPSIVSRRAFSAAAVKPAAFRPKTEREVWLGDAGAYPVMATILFGLCFTSSVIVWSSFSNNDARWSTSTRKSLFRGEMANEYQHPARPTTH
jgi:hypothetical protein